MPFGRGQWFLNNNAFLDRVVGGWSVSFTGNYTSGALVLLNAPLTYPNWGFAYGRKRVNLTGQPIRTNVSRGDLDPRNTNLRWLNPGLFSIPGTYELGNSPTYVNEMRDPPAFTRQIRRHQAHPPSPRRFNFEFAASFSNIFNRTNSALAVRQ